MYRVEVGVILGRHAVELKFMLKAIQYERQSAENDSYRGSGRFRTECRRISTSRGCLTLVNC